MTEDNIFYSGMSLMIFGISLIRHSRYKSTYNRELIQFNHSQLSIIKIAVKSLLCSKGLDPNVN